MFVVGLTGGIGSGKSTVAKEFAKLDVQVIDADQIAREVVEPGSTALNEISEHFGADIVDSNGELNRKALREIVFADHEAREWLESLLHPLIAERIQQRVATSQSEYCILESPLLLETTQADFVHRVLVVDVLESTQLTRTMERDSSPRATIEAIIQSQLPRKQRLEAADDILDNELPLQTLSARIKELHAQYLALAQSHDE
ncbi:MAG: dephospho-CoA kinase [Pseudomonadales bacterium]|nr:dephospho-CoA kinase [Pseudomonadales bacterium]